MMDRNGKWASIFPTKLAADLLRRYYDDDDVKELISYAKNCHEMFMAAQANITNQNREIFVLENEVRLLKENIE